MTERKEMGWSLTEILVTAVLFAIFSGGVLLLANIDLAAMREDALRRADARLESAVYTVDGVGYIIEDAGVRDGSAP